MKLITIKDDTFLKDQYVGHSVERVEKSVFSIKRTGFFGLKPVEIKTPGGWRVWVYLKTGEKLYNDFKTEKEARLEYKKITKQL